MSENLNRCSAMSDGLTGKVTCNNLDSMRDVYQYGIYRKKKGPTAYKIPKGVERLKRDLRRACSEALTTVEHSIRA